MTCFSVNFSGTDDANLILQVIITGLARARLIVKQIHGFPEKFTQNLSKYKQNCNLEKSASEWKIFPISFLFKGVIVLHQKLVQSHFSKIKIHKI